MRKHDRPVLLGEISLETRLNLRQTRELLDGLVDDGTVRELTKEECAAYTNMYQGYAFVLVRPTDFPIGDLD